MRFLSTSILIIAFQIFSYSQGIDFFQGTWAEALEKAQEEDKPLFVDAYTTWCGPCKAMAKNTFTKAEVGEFFNKNFINVKLDMEKEDGVKFGHKYPVSAYPTLYFINEKGDVLKKSVGGKKPTALIEVAKVALKANDKSGDFEEAYLAGNRDYDLVYNYVKALADVGKPTLKISNDYLDSNPQISEGQRLKFLFISAVEADSKIFEEVVANKEQIALLVGEEEYKSKIESACKKTLDKAIEYEYEGLLDDALSKAQDVMSKEEYESFKYESQLHYYAAFNQHDKYLATAEKYASSDKKNPVTLAFVAASVCDELKEDTKALKKAEKWAKKAFKLEKNNSTFFTYCNTLIAVKEYDKVLKMVDEELADEKTIYDLKNLKRMKSYVNRLKSQES